VSKPRFGEPENRFSGTGCDRCAPDDTQSRRVVCRGWLGMSDETTRANKTQPTRRMFLVVASSHSCPNLFPRPGNLIPMRNSRRLLARSTKVKPSRPGFPAWFARRLCIRTIRAAPGGEVGRDRFGSRPSVPFRPGRQWRTKPDRFSQGLGLPLIRTRDDAGLASRSQYGRQDFRPVSFASPPRRRDEY
jgi:hypothetical protein